MIRRRILVVISYDFKEIGGHLLSAVTLASHLFQQGSDVGLLVAPLRFDIPEFEHTPVRIHQIPYVDGARVYPYRMRQIEQVMRQYSYDSLITMDWRALYQSIPTLWRLAPLLVQVQAGGIATQRPFLKQPGIVVFSEELHDHYCHNLGISSQYIRVSTGRVNFSMYQMTTDSKSTLAFRDATPRILVVSRMTAAKGEAIMHLLNEVEQVAKQQPIQVIIVGDGEVRSELEQKANDICTVTQGRADIRFAGAFRITGDELRQADLVVGQGRTVIEAVAAGVPSAVSGKDGYFGLVTSQTLPALARTNLTGRGIDQRGQLSHDLERLPTFRENEFSLVQDQMFNMYDVSEGATAILRSFEDIENTYPYKRVRRLHYIRATFTDLLPSLSAQVSQRLLRLVKSIDT